jgi:hypothetical protein
MPISINCTHYANKRCQHPLGLSGTLFKTAGVCIEESPTLDRRASYRCLVKNPHVKPEIPPLPPKI